MITQDMYYEETGKSAPKGDILPVVNQAEPQPETASDNAIRDFVKALNISGTTKQQLVILVNVERELSRKHSFYLNQVVEDPLSSETAG